MTRGARHKILYDGCYAHIISRSIEERVVFERDEDFRVFKEWMKEIKVAFDFRIHHYCLMNTHFHWLVSVKRVDEFSEGLQRIKWQYTKWFNKKRKRRGPLWRERFKSLVIENEDSLYACGAYIENNPVRAGRVKRPDDWLYSSSRHYERGENDVLIDHYERGRKLELLDEFGAGFFTKGHAIGSRVFRARIAEIVFDECVSP